MSIPIYMQGNVGDTIEIDTPDDITAATLKQFRFRKPDGTVADVTAVFSGTGSDGKLKVVTVAPAGFNFDQAGPWQVRAYVEIGVNKYRTQPAEFYVKADL